jgi:predicted Zn-dependent protease
MPEVSLNSSFLQHSHAKFRTFSLVLLLSFATLTPISSLLAQTPAQAQAQAPPLLTTLSDELNRAFSQLGKTTPPASPPATTSQKNSSKADEKNPPQPPYFISYSISDSSAVSIRAQYGALTDSSDGHSRTGDIVVRIGDPTLDNTHGTHHSSASNGIGIPLGNDSNAIAHSLWQVTNIAYARALDSFLRVKTESQVRAKEEDTSADFSKEKPQISIGTPAAPPKVNRAAWEKRVRALSAIFREFPDVYQNMVVFSAQSETDYFVSSEGSRIVEPHTSARLVVYAVTRADDGMDLFRDQTFEAETADGLPDESVLEAGMRELGKSLEALRKAPMTEPYNGPAILSGRASAVFFHEVLGHRLEGQRQRGDEEGQTFTKELNKPVLPSFLSVADDPTISTFGKTWLSGTYAYDDEGQKARRVDLIDDGVLKTFLMSRLPIASFSTSNGHGRAQTGKMPTGRQGNLIVSSTKTVTDQELRQQLIVEAKKQGKPYGLFFEDISSGFAVTQRSSPQAFQVIPLVVWRVYVDGRPDELVRGVSIVGTPLAAMNRILMTSDKSEVFNGECGAESGTVPVSAVAPAMLLSEMETQRQPQGTARPPILPIPGAPDDGTSKLAVKEAK